MGECGCCEVPISQMVALPCGSVVTLGVYRGCTDCGLGMAVVVKFWDSMEHADDWAFGLTPETITPDEYGGNDGFGVVQGLFDFEDLYAAARAIEAAGAVVNSRDPGYDDEDEGDEDGDDDEDSYESVALWLEDHGLELLQDAMARFDRRCAAELETRNSEPATPL
jgi:hypothetical protein